MGIEPWTKEVVDMLKEEQADKGSTFCKLRIFYFFTNLVGYTFLKSKEKGLCYYNLSL